MIRPARKQAQGFTIIELMLVMVVIGVLSSLIAPSVGAMMSDARQGGAAEHLVRLHRHVRARVLQTGLAHLVQWDGAATGNLGRLRVWEGMNNHCSSTPWDSAVGAGGQAAGHAPVEMLDMADYNPNNGSAPTSADQERQVIRLTAKEITGASPIASTAINLCFQPNGLIYVDAAGGGWAFSQQTRPLVFVVTRTLNGVQHGMLREVIFPVGGPARHLQ